MDGTKPILNQIEHHENEPESPTLRTYTSQLAIFIPNQLSKCKRVETSGKELNAGQHIFEW